MERSTDLFQDKIRYPGPCRNICSIIRFCFSLYHTADSEFQSGQFYNIPYYHPPHVRTPPTCSYCHAVSRGFFEPLLSSSQHTYAHMMKAVLRNAACAYDATHHTFAIFVVDTNSVSRRDNPHFCSFHNTVQFLFKKCIEYVNIHH